MQSRWMSVVEAVTNIVVGYGLAVLTQIIVFPMFGLSMTLEQNLKIGIIFTSLSIALSFVLRRAFELVQVRAYVSSSHDAGTQ
jgi:hypothetical protein